MVVLPSSYAGGKSARGERSSVVLVKEALGDCEVGGIRLVDAKITGRLDFHPRIAMQILRHSKIGLTMEIYTEVPSAAIRDALKRLGRWLGN